MALRATLLSMLGRDDPPPKRRTSDDFLDDLLGDPFGPAAPDVDRSPFAKAKKPIPTKAADVGGVAGEVLRKHVLKPQRPDVTTTPRPLFPSMKALPERTGRSVSDYTIPEPSMGEKIATAGASWLPPVDVPLALEGIQKAQRGNVSGGAGTVALAMAGLIPGGKIVKELKAGRAAAKVAGKLEGTIAGEVLSHMGPHEDVSWAVSPFEKAVAKLGPVVRAADVRLPGKVAIQEEARHRGFNTLLEEAAKTGKPLTKAELRAHLDANPLPTVSEDLPEAPFPLYSAGIRGVNQHPEGFLPASEWRKVLDKSTRQAELTETGMDKWLAAQDPAKVFARHEIAGELRGRLPNLGHADRGFTTAAKADKKAYDAAEGAFDYANEQAKRVIANHVEDEDEADFILNRLRAGEPLENVLNLEDLGTYHTSLLKRYLDVKGPAGAAPKAEKILYPGSYRIPGEEIAGTEGDLVTKFNRKDTNPLPPDPKVGQKIRLWDKDYTVELVEDDGWITARDSEGNRKPISRRSYLAGIGWKENDVLPSYRHESHTSGVNDPLVFTRVGERTNEAGERVLATQDVQADYAQDARKFGWKDETYPQREAAADQTRIDVEKERQALDQKRLDLRWEIANSPELAEKRVELEALGQQRREMLTNLYRQQYDKMLGVVRSARGAEPLTKEAESILWDDAVRTVSQTAEAAHLRNLINKGTVDHQLNDLIETKFRTHPSQRAMIEQEMDLYDRGDAAANIRRAVPSHMPFRSGELPAELGIKRLLHEGIQRDVDWVTLPTGEQVNDMFSLRNMVDRLEWSPTTGELYGYRGKDQVVNHGAVHSRKKLAEYIGKERVDKLLSKPMNENGDFVLKGDEIDAVGGGGNVKVYGNREYYSPTDPAKIQQVAAMKDELEQASRRFDAAGDELRAAKAARNQAGGSREAADAANERIRAARIAEDAALNEQDAIRTRMNDLAGPDFKETPDKPVRGNLVGVVKDIGNKVGVPMKLEGMPAGGGAQTVKEAQKAFQDASRSYDEAVQALRSSDRSDPVKSVHLAQDVNYYKAVVEQALKNFDTIRGRQFNAGGITGNPSIRLTPAIKAIKKWPVYNVAATVGLGGVAGKVLSERGLVPKDTTVKNDGKKPRR